MAGKKAFLIGRPQSDLGRFGFCPSGLFPAAAQLLMSVCKISEKMSRDQGCAFVSFAS